MRQRLKLNKYNNYYILFNLIFLIIKVCYSGSYFFLILCYQTKWDRSEMEKSTNTQLYRRIRLLLFINTHPTRFNKWDKNPTRFPSYVHIDWLCHVFLLLIPAMLLYTFNHVTWLSQEHIHRCCFPRSDFSPLTSVSHGEDTPMLTPSMPLLYAIIKHTWHTSIQHASVGRGGGEEVAHARRCIAPPPPSPNSIFPFHSVSPSHRHFHCHLCGRF